MNVVLRVLRIELLQLVRDKRVLFSAIVLSMKKHETQITLSTKLQAKCRFSCGRQSLAVLDKHFGHEITKLARQGVSEIKPAKRVGNQKCSK